MKFLKTDIADFLTVDLDPFKDDRGSFARMFCVDEFKKALPAGRRINQINLSKNYSAGTFRGFHAQHPPFSEEKILFCMRGALTDYVIDLRPSSSTFLKLAKVDLNDRNERAVIVPSCCAHAIFTQSDFCEAVYISTAAYEPASEIIINPMDPLISSQMNIDIKHISDKDRNAEFLGSFDNAKSKLIKLGYV